MNKLKGVLQRMFNVIPHVVFKHLPLDRLLDLESYICLGYRLILGRRPDPGGMAHFKAHIEGQGLPKAFIFEALASSPEYKKAQSPMSYVRAQLVRQYLPPANVIVDFGGSTKHMEEGALYAMGYTQKWQKMLIVDLPHEARDEQWRPEQSEQKVVETPNGPVEHIPGSMADRSLFSEGGFADLVWSGNAIEHITEADGDAFLQNVRHVLKPGGSFCLDTPNRDVTRIQLPDQLTNPDHKLEYTHAGLSAKLKANGFVIEEQMGVLDCATVVKSGVFEESQLAECPDFTDKIENGYFLYYRCRKPANRDPVLSGSSS